MRSRVLPLIAVVAMAAAACSSQEPGQPTPKDPGPTATSTPPSETGTAPAEFPQRPEELPVTGAKPCELLTQAQRSQLKVVRADESDYQGQPECAFTVEGGEPYLDVAILLDSREGAEAWFTEQRNVEVESTTIDGYGAANFWLDGTTGAGCDTAVDVADGQQLRVSLLLPGKDWTQDKLCETTDRFAAAALATLRAG